MLRLSSFVFLLSISTAFASTLVLGPEQAASSLSYRPQPVAPNPKSAVIATDGDTFMTAWATTYSPGHGAIFVAPLNANGIRQSIKMVTSGAEANSLFISWAGSAYRLVWYSGGLYSADVDRNGETVVSPHLFDQRGYGADAWDLAATSDRTLITSFFFGLFDATGTLLGSAPMPTTKLGAAALDRDGANIFWLDHETLYARRMDRNGNFGAPVAIAEVRGATKIAATSNGQLTELAVADANAIHRFTIDRWLNATSLKPRTASGVTTLRVTTQGSGFLVYWTTSNGLFTTAKDDEVETRITSSAPMLAAGSAHIVGVNSAMNECIVDIAPQFSALQFVPIGDFPIPQTGGAIASIGSQSLVIWSELRPNDTGTTSPTIVGNLIAADGSRISDVLPIAISGNASVAAVANEYWVLWTNEYLQLCLRRIRSDGSMTDVRVYAQIAGPPVVATNGQIVVAAFSTADGMVQAVRLTPSGALLDSTPLTIAAARGYNHSISAIALASNSDSFLVTFSDVYRDCPPQLCAGGYSTQVRAVQLDASGNPIDAQPIDITRTYSTLYGNVNVEDVASDGRDYFIVYRELNDVYAKRFLREGALADGVASQEGVRIARAARLARVERFADGYLVAATGQLIRTDFLGNRIEDPILLGGTVSDLTPNQIVYTRPADELEAAGATRVFTRTLTLNAPRIHAVRRRY